MLVRMLEAEGVETLPQLSNLTISGVPKLALPSLSSVESLHASGGNQRLLKSLFEYNYSEDVTSLPGGIACNMQHLKKLTIDHFDKLKVLPDELGTLFALEGLHISYCDELESFSEHVLKGLSSLRTLTILSCLILKSLSKGMGHLTCLERLEIAGCPQLVLPEGLEQIPSLQILTLSHFPSLTSFPDWLGAMTSLQKLEISSCPKLTSLPASFQKLKNLHELRISECPILVKRCKKGTGDDWHKIAHIPELELNEESFSEDIIFLWKMRKQFLQILRYGDLSEDEFDSMVDV